MKTLLSLLCLVLIYCGCSGVNEVEPVDEAVEAEYTLTVDSSIGGDHSFTLEGTTTNWSSGIGHMSLGPEDPNCDRPVGALQVTWNPTLIDLEEAQIDTSATITSSFWSALYWCEDLGNQEANWYDVTDLMGAVKFGVDNRGLKFVKGTIIMSMTRSLLNEADVPEDISVNAEFTAVE